MATTVHSSTPPPPSSIRTPTTPRFGFEDNYQPYSPRKSARVSHKSRAAQTPPPQSSIHNLRTSHSSPRSSKKVAFTNLTGITSSPLSSPPTASKKKVPKNSPVVGGRRVSGALDYDSTASAAAALGISPPKNDRKMEGNRSATTIRNSGMLPTPAKTPKKRPSESAPGITAIARNLFPVRAETVEEVMPSPKKKGRKRYTSSTLDSFDAEDEDAAPIQIYTDSHDRVPEVDMSADNPFYGESSNAQPEPTKRSSKRRKITVPGEGEQTVEEAEQREDGLVYVFRGKKIFRKFTDVEETGSVTQDDSDDVKLAETVPDNLRRPLTRSSIKPRLLFPTPQQTKAKEMRSQATEDEEEAITDIEEQHGLSTPMDHLDDAVATPQAPKFAPFSPPTTARTTRSKQVDMSGSPVAPISEDDSESPMRKGRGAKVSPFDKWQRTKGGVRGGGKKREGEPISRASASKKVRG